MESVLNINIGIMGHVDSGKTSIAKLISTIPSTACFDKNTQSQERGITIDLGFSSLSLKTPDHIKNDVHSDSIQLTFVDCPGHASLIKTIIGGAQIMDMMLLVIDSMKGIQSQTAECIVIGEITCEHALIVLNKVDLFPADKRENMIAKMILKLKKVFESTKFAKAQIVPLTTLRTDECKGYHISNVIEVLASNLFIPNRSVKGPFLMNVDHCFNIKGHGTVLTGTILNGSIVVNQDIELPELKIVRKVKSIQMYKKSINKAMQGDRIGLSISQFDASSFERGLICSPSTLEFAYGAMCDINIVRYFKENCCSNSKFHISIGHETFMAKVMFCKLDAQSVSSNLPHSDIQEMSSNPKSPVYDVNGKYILIEQLKEVKTSSYSESAKNSKNNYAFLQFEKPHICASQFLYIASRLDLTTEGDSSKINAQSGNSKTCRLAFYGHIIHTYNTPIGSGNKVKSETNQRLPKIYKIKEKYGIVERLHDERTVIVRSMFKKDSKIDAFAGFTVNFYRENINDVQLEAKPLFSGTIEGSFGQSGKVKVAIKGDIPEQYKVKMKVVKRSMADKTVEIYVSSKENIIALMRFKKYLFDTSKKSYPADVK